MTRQWIWAALLPLTIASCVHGEEARLASSPLLDEAVQQAVDEGQVPGAVLLVGHRGQVVHRKAYGNRSLVPRVEPMTVDTVFDVASLTKVIATTSAMARLVERGKVRLADRVTVYLPEFQGGRSDITVRQLLTHFSGLRPDVDLVPAWSGYETGIRLALTDKPVAAPGTRFIYSDINFVLLGEIVRRVSGQTLADFVQAQVFRPLGMARTTFNPPVAWRSGIAPTEAYPGMTEPLRGVVHDPTARYMGGVAGHAGLFSTADDLARFAEMMLGRGKRAGVTVLSPLMAEKAVEPQTPPHQPILRGLGWDIDSPYSSTRGELFPVGSYGHTGFTGTSLWIDPVTDTYVILLSNSVHPKTKQAITPLRSRIATIVAGSIGIEAQKVQVTSYNELAAGPGGRRVVARNAQVLTGLDVLAGDSFRALQGRRIGLITNHTGLGRDGRRNMDMMRAAGVQLTALFSPEHGFAGREDHENVGDSRDPATGVPVYSLYSGKTRAPSAEMLGQVDALVFDIQDVGARFYTYVCTMANAMEVAAKAGKAFYVLDRPNPINGVMVEGPLLDDALHSFVGCVSMPVRHGMTVGEVARMVSSERQDGLALTVIPMRNWLRGDWFDSTGLVWRDPSPNMRSLTAALLYPGVAMLEYSANYSVGRGTDAPFEQVGAEWIVGRDLAALLNSRFIPGLRVYPTRFQPASSNLAGKQVEGVRFVITDRDAFQGSRLGLELASALLKLYPGRIDLQANAKLIGSQAVIDALRKGEDPRLLALRLDQELSPFLERRRRALLY